MWPTLTLIVRINMALENYGAPYVLHHLWHLVSLTNWSYIVLYLSTMDLYFYQQLSN